MCKKKSDNKLCLIKDDSLEWSFVKIDSCMVWIVNRLNAAGLYTKGCCCGHGEFKGYVRLHDGTKMSVEDAAKLARQLQVNDSALPNGKDIDAAIKKKKVSTSLLDINEAIDGLTTFPGKWR